MPEVSISSQLPVAYDYTNLVFEGGGVKGIAYAGALQVLTETGILKNITRVAGTSAGAITACLVALGYTAEEITTLIMNLDFKTFEDHWDPLRLPTKYGLYAGDAFLSWLQDRIAGKGLDPNITFAELKEKSPVELYVYATDLNNYSYQQFSALPSDFPGTIVAEAVRASMSIPLFFKAWKFSNGVPTSHVYVDGGVVLNYPLTVFDNVTHPQDMQTLGFYLKDVHDLKAPSTLDYDQPVQYCKSLFETLLDAQEIDFSVDPGMEDRTVRINDHGILATDFNITTNQKQLLYSSGCSATAAFLNLHPPPSCTAPVSQA